MDDYGFLDIGDIMTVFPGFPRVRRAIIACGGQIL
jgi:hypothetical protein